jgi:bifunctional DNA-binding transcriptional regulator/antitoxin component of YhaV-PrlF toxin-antitoxin module
MTMSYDFEVKEKGRAVLPAGLRRDCGFDVGVRVTARPLGPGRALLETADSVIERIWSGVPGHPTDGVEDLKRWRSEQAAASANVATVADEGTDGPAVGDQLLKALGLD